MGLVGTVLREERKGRRRARRMAREMSGAMQNPISSVSGLATGAFEGATEDMSGGSKVLLLLLAAGAIGGGAYWYFTQKSATASAGTTPGVQPATPAQQAAVSASAPVALTGQAAVQAVIAAGQGAGSSQAQIDAYKAVALAATGHGPGKEGDVWAKRAAADGASATQLNALRQSGYSV